MYTGRMIRIAVWGSNERCLCALIVGLVIVSIVYASMGWPNV